MHSRSVRLLAGGLLALGTSFWSAAARAEANLAADLDYAAPIDSNASTGWGLGARLGWHLHVPLVEVTPELALTYHGFGGEGSPKVYRGTAGLRMGIGEIFRIGPFAHLGMGSLDLTGVSGSHTAFTYDAGLFFDFTLLPFLNVGVHGAYNHVAAGDQGPTVQFATAGAHVALVF